MATPTIPIEAMFADYVDLFSADYLRDSAYGQNDYVYWIKQNFLNIILIIVLDHYIKTVYYYKIMKLYF